MVTSMESSSNTSTLYLYVEASVVLVLFVWGLGEYSPFFTCVIEYYIKPK